MSRVYDRAARVVCWLALLSLSCRPSPESYRTFTRHNASYYAKFASAMDQVFAYGSTNLTNGVAHKMDDGSIAYEVRVRGNESWLPYTIRDINPTELRIYSDRVVLMMGVGRIGGYGVSWKADDQNPMLWQLTASGEGARVILYSERKEGLKRSQ